MRPDTEAISIELPSMDTPMGHATGQACGQSYAKATPIAQRYKTVNKYTATLPPAWGGSSETIGQEIAGAVEDAISLAQDTIDGKNPDVWVRLLMDTVPTSGGDGQLLVVTDPSNRQAIGHMLDRARHYLAQAKALWSYWADEWRVEVVKEYPHDGRPLGLEVLTAELGASWPLSLAAVGEIPTAGSWCEDQPAGQVIKVTNVAPGVDADIRCPTSAIREQHAQDRQLYEALAEAALLWARCAQEAAYVVGLHHLNRRSYETSAVRGSRFAATPTEKPVVPDPGIYSAPVPPEPPPGGEDLPVPPPPLPPTAPPETSPEETDVAVRRTGFSALPAPVKLGALAGGAFVLHRLLAR